MYYLGMIIVFLPFAVIWFYILHYSLKLEPKYATFIMILLFVCGIFIGKMIDRPVDNKPNAQIDQTNTCSCIHCENNVDAEGEE